ncbi:MAG: type 1 glutamine amidotransferase domain-containing protein [Promethearchaeota archaeon]
MTKKIVILATDGFEDAELLYPYYRLKEAGHSSIIISLQERLIKGKNGYPIKPDLKIDDANPDYYDGIIIPGGTNNPDYLRRSQKVLNFVAKINEQNKLVAAICHAGWVLISAKIVKGKKATCYFPIKDDMINAGVIYEDSPVIVDGNLITSRAPQDLPEFMKAILNYLKNK